MAGVWFAVVAEYAEECATEWFQLQLAAVVNEQAHAELSALSKAAAQTKKQVERDPAGRRGEVEAWKLEFAAMQAHLAQGAGSLRRNQGSCSAQLQQAAAKGQACAELNAHSGVAAQAKQQAERATAGLLEDAEVLELESAAKQAQWSQDAGLSAQGAGTLRQHQDSRSAQLQQAAAKGQACAELSAHNEVAAQAKLRAERGTAGLLEDVEVLELELAANMAHLSQDAGAPRQYLGSLSSKFQQAAAKGQAHAEPSAQSDAAAQAMQREERDTARCRRRTSPWSWSLPQSRRWWRMMRVRFGRSRSRPSSRSSSRPVKGRCRAMPSVAAGLIQIQ